MKVRVRTYDELAGRYWRISDLYLEQRKAMDKMMDARLEEWPRRNGGQL